MLNITMGKGVRIKKHMVIFNVKGDGGNERKMSVNVELLGSCAGYDLDCNGHGLVYWLESYFRGFENKYLYYHGVYEYDVFDSIHHNGTSFLCNGRRRS